MSKDIPPRYTFFPLGDSSSLRQIQWTLTPEVILVLVALLCAVVGAIAIRRMAATPLRQDSSSSDAGAASPYGNGGGKVVRPTKKTKVEDLREALRDLGLDTKGKKETVYKRLLNVFRLQAAPSEVIADADEATPRPDDRSQKHGSFLCFDVEATCRGGKEFDYPNEIIEFPVVLLQWTTPDLSDPSTGPTLEVRDTFHSYVRPTWRPRLTDFCMALTGITQEMVDGSPTFLEVMRNFETWLDGHGLRGEDGGLKDALWVTDGPWDLRDFVPKQLHITPHPIAYPPYLLGPYLNLKQAVAVYLHDSHLASRPRRITTAKRLNADDRKQGRERGFWLTITGMVDKLGLGEFEGRAHSGIADATNISRVVCHLARENVLLEPNGWISKQGARQYEWMTGGKGVVKWNQDEAVPELSVGKEDGMVREGGGPKEGDAAGVVLGEEIKA